jgi:hypothetical protein
MLHTGLRLLHLAIVVLVVGGFNLVVLVARVVYKLFPYPSALDGLWRRVGLLRELFAFQLGRGDPQTPLELQLAASTRQLIEAAGYGCEEHTVVTADGYVLTMHRIICTPSPRQPSTHDGTAFPATPPGESFTWQAGPPQSAASTRSGVPNSGRPPVLFQHGLMECSEVWVVGTAANSLAFAAAEAGFDVWLGNNRGKYVKRGGGEGGVGVTCAPPSIVVAATTLECKIAWAGALPVAVRRGAGEPCRGHCRV